LSPFTSFLVIIVVGITLLVYSFVEPHLLQVREVQLEDADVPAAFDNLKAAFISDIHHGPYFSLDRVQLLVERVNGLKPDLIILGGDYVHRDNDYIQPCFEELKKLNAPLGKFGVLGNHDHWEGAQLTRKMMKEAGITLIDNKACWIEKDGKKIKLGGVGDLWVDDQDIEPTIRDVEDEDFVILVSHNPDYVEEIETSRIDLVMSGHTHGGQATVFGLWGPCVPSVHGQKYRTGTVETELTKVIVSNGVGTITPPARFCARPDIILLTLKSAFPPTSGGRGGNAIRP